jgi:tetratricopeptide (TPR) repeat protein
LLVLVVVLAFLSALFPVYNSDFFQHLAAGRLLTQGGLSFSSDAPDPFTAPGTGWVNHSWVFDLIVYALYQMSQAAPIILKALLTAVLAGVLIHTGRVAGQRLWLPAVCTALAVLVLSPALLMRPVVCSMLFLALTLWLLRRPEAQRQALGAQGKAAEADAVRPLQSWGWLVPLFALWASCDAWFILGPITAGLFLLGAYLQQRSSSATASEKPLAKEQLRQLGIVLGLGILACMANPYHVRIWQLPVELELSETASLLGSDAGFRVLWESPLAPGGLFFQPEHGLCGAGQAYFLLLVVGLASFLTARDVVPTWRVLVWVLFALLSGWRVAVIPFFAVVSGPIASLNFLDFAARKVSVPARWSVSGRVLTIFGVVLLGVATWPGWLQAQPWTMRRVGLGVHVDSALYTMTGQVQKIAEWNRTRTGQEPVWFNTDPAVVHYLSWFCPGQRGWIDDRLNVPTSAAAAHHRVLQGLVEVRSQTDAEKPLAWREVFHNEHLQYLIYHAPDLFGEVPVLRTLLELSGEWPLLGESAPAAIFGWLDLEAIRDERASEAEKDKQRHLFDPVKWPRSRLAFGEKKDGVVEAPDEGPGRDAMPRLWLTTLWQPEPLRPAAASRARFYRMQFDIEQPYVINRHARNWVGVTAASLTGLAAAGSMPGGPGLTLAWPVGFGTGLVPWMTGSFPDANKFVLARVNRNFHQGYVSAQDHGPPTALYLSIRTARQALLKDPDESAVWLLLGQAYSDLQHSTREGTRGGNLVFLTQLRRVQIVTALQQALKVNPDLEDAHRLLFAVFDELGYLDLVAKHLREQLRCARANGPRPGEKPERYQERLQQLEAFLKDVEDELKKRQDRYLLAVANRDEGQQIMRAVAPPQDGGFGLIETGIEKLTKLKPEDLFPKEGKGSDAGILLIELLLRTGQADEARRLMSEHTESLQGVFHQGLGVPAFPWFMTCLAAAAGDYETAEKYLELLIRGAQRPAEQADKLRAAIAQDVATIHMQSLRHVSGYPLLLQWFVVTTKDQQYPPFSRPIPMMFENIKYLSEQLLGPVQLQASLEVLRGWLYLEWGRTEVARETFDRAQEISKMGGERQLEYPGRGLAALGLEWMTRAQSE